MATKLILRSYAAKIVSKNPTLELAGPYTVKSNFSLWSLFSRKTKKPEPVQVASPLLSQDKLFHPFLFSPIKDIQIRGELIQNHGVCPTCTKDNPSPEFVTPQTVAKSQRPVFTCEDCGLPTHCSESHYQQDIENHRKHCPALRQINEDEHDLRSGREFPEFNFPKALGPESTVNLTSWDTFFVTRGFKGVDDARSVRHVSKLLTYPLTIASALHSFGPHRPGSKGLTIEGVKSLTALQYTMDKEEYTYHKKQKELIKQQIRVFILGARAEAQLPPYAYLQLCYLFPNVSFQLYFVGPEAIPPVGVPEKLAINPHLSFNYLSGLFHEKYHEIIPFDPYHDVFFLFSPGLAYPYTQPLWEPTIKLLLETKCPIFITGYDDADLSQDAEILKSNYKDDLDWLLHPSENPFRSLKADLNLQDVRLTLQANHGIMAVRGKRYEVASS